MDLYARVVTDHRVSPGTRRIDRVQQRECEEYPTTLACFERAIQRAITLVPYAKSMLDRQSHVHPDTWNDVDVGTASWVECDSREEPVLASFDVLLHEVNHSLTKGACLHEFTTDQPLCFDLDKDLPPRSIARIPDDAPGLDNNNREALDGVQALYFTANDQGPQALFDELMAYRITAEVYAARLRIPGEVPANAYKLNHLPLFMDFSVRYVNELAKQDPARAAKAFGVGTRNRTNLVALLDRAELSYQRWLDAMTSAHRKPSKFERAFWDAYRRDRAAWLAVAKVP